MTNLYSGNLGGVSTWASDLEKARTEIKIINVLDKVNKKVTFKPYPEVNKRYFEKNPCLELVEKKKNIEFIKNNYDARYLINNSQLLICGTATSTISWVAMSNIPTVFINFKYIAPLKPDAYFLFKKALFLFDYDDKNFSSNIKLFLNQNISDIRYQWKKKKVYRDELKEKFISTTCNNKLEYFNKGTEKKK